MDFSKRCVGDFSARDWRLGGEYFRSQAVTIGDLHDSGLSAQVRGSRSTPYQVRLNWSDAARGTLLVHCSCPRFAEIDLCKHVAATIQAANARGIGASVPGRGTLDLLPETDAGEGFADDDVEANDDFDGPGASGFSADAWDDAGRVKALSQLLTKSGGRDSVGSVLAAMLQSVSRRNSKPKRAEPKWQEVLAQFEQLTTPATSRQARVPSGSQTQPRQVWYVLNIRESEDRGRPSVHLRQAPVKKDGVLGKLRKFSLQKHEIAMLESAEDRTLVGLLFGNDRTLDYSYFGDSGYSKCGQFSIAPALFDVLLPKLCASGRFGWQAEDGRTADEEIRLLSWDEGPAWKVHLDIDKTVDKKHWAVMGRLRRADEVRELQSSLLLLSEGVVVFPDRIARLDMGDDFRWASMFRLRSEPIRVPIRESDEFVAQLVGLRVAPNVEWPSELQWEEVQLKPAPLLKISKPAHAWNRNLECRLSFQYGERRVPFGGGEPFWYAQESRQAVRRDLLVEAAAMDELLSAGAERMPYYGYNMSTADVFSLKPAKMPDLVQRLTGAGWQVEAEGKLVRQPGQLSLNLTSGVDWFDLEGECDFGGVTASLPKLLAALRQGEKFVQLDDGTRGLLPEQWLATYGPLADMGQVDGDRVKFQANQAALVDAMLAAQESQIVSFDAGFTRLRDKLQAFSGVSPCTEPPTFTGELRPYQREGLGWLGFLDEFGFGGCLADDMGLGKTVQILALLEQRRQVRLAAGPRNKARQDSAPAVGPSLVVVPRSLVFNWIEEARRFTPELRVLNFTGLERKNSFDQLSDFDLIVTTYGTLRRDIVKLRDVEFDYVILDEAQAIKNAASQSAKVCRLLRARRRLAMTGTPVENHLGELWSLFEFLNPGMLGGQSSGHSLLAGARRGRGLNGESDKDEQSARNLSVLARGLRPFMLRRTKQQVLTELPAKTEQTLYCELDGTQRQLYDELRDHYRRSLLDRVDKVGLNRSKIQVLEALLRLRQAACHPGLLDKKKRAAGSAKFEALLEQLTEVTAEGHKALVFSQFTSLLGILRGELDDRKIVYEYLDGRTVKRQAKVERFQTDAACPLFLISLKAGGHGLNLTAADYVFILDPWWNPAVEAQAVDRAHRMGQNRHVFAYRLIARNTVEEKILQLQDRKRDLAQAIISADNSVMQNLTAEDLQLLLS